MISSSPLQCRHCQLVRYQKVLFIGGEFAYQCPDCSATHLFYENLFFDINENFKHSRWSRYVGYWLDGKMHDIQNRGIAEHFDLLFSNQESSAVEFQIVHLSDRQSDSRFFVASMLHDHFQEAFRALYHMKGSLDKIKAHNVLLMPNQRFNFLLEEKEKLKGIDEVWIIPFFKEIRWPYINNVADAKRSWKVCNAIQQVFDRMEGLGVCINKRAGAVQNGKELLKDLLEPLHPRPLYDTQDRYLFSKYVGVLVHKDSASRSGLGTPAQLQKVCDFIVQQGCDPLVIATSNWELEIAARQTHPIVYVPQIDKQAQLYRDCIAFVVATNCSGCNIPALYGIPMFVYVKERGFPDDFYCFARMASTYDPRKWPWYSELEKADNIIEHKVPLELGIPLEQSFAELGAMLDKHVVRNQIKHGQSLLKKGYTLPCPSCKQENTTRKKVIKRTDVFANFICSCGTQYSGHYGITTSSFVGVAPFVEQSADDISISERLKVEVLKRKKNPIYFLALKPSIADLYYVLPSLLRLRKDYPDHSLRVITHSEYRSLIPEVLVDEFYLLDLASPYVLIKETILEEQLLSNIIGEAPLINNYPGVLPHSRNVYFETRSLFSLKENPNKVWDVVVCARLGKRAWPSLSALRELQKLLDKKKLKHYTLVFPKSEMDFEITEWARLSNLAVNPAIEAQIAFAESAKVWLCAHGASQVIPSITMTKQIELETSDSWWKSSEPQPIRFGLPRQWFKQLKGETLGSIPLEEIVTAIEQFR